MNETIDNIVHEMRELANLIADNESEGADVKSVWSIISTFADRIETAAKHTCEYAIPNFGCASENRYLEENARLLSALTRLHKVAKNRMPHEPTLDEIEALYIAEKLMKECGVK